MSDAGTNTLEELANVMGAALHKIDALCEEAESRNESTITVDSVLAAIEDALSW